MAHNLADLLELVPRFGVEIAAVEVVDGDRTRRGVAELPERGRDHAHVRVALTLAKRLRDRVFGPLGVATVEPRVRLVEVEEHDPPFLRREDIDVVLPATHSEGRHEPPEAIEI